MRLRPWDRLRESGPQLARPRSDHGGASKTLKIPSIHLIHILPAVPAPTRPSKTCMKPLTASQPIADVRRKGAMHSTAPTARYVQQGGVDSSLTSNLPEWKITGARTSANSRG
jgi:hypothetical protein